MADPGYRGAGSVSSGGSTTNSLNVPIAGTGYTGGTVIAGDAALLVGDWGAGAVSDLIVTDAATTTAIYSAGDSTLTGRAFVKIVTSTDVANGYITISTAGTNARASAGVIVVSDPGTIDVTAPAADDANDLSQPVPASSSIAPFMAAVSAVSVANAATQVSTTAPSGTTERFDRLTTNGSGRKPGVYGFTFNSGGPTSSTAYATTQNSHAVTWVFGVNAAATAQNEAGGSSATVVSSASGAGAAVEVRTGGSAVTVSTSVTGGGTAAEARSGGSVTGIAAGVSGAGVGIEAAAGGSVAAVTTTASGSGSGSEQVAAGSTSTVATTTAGAGTATETATGGSAATITVTVTSGGTDGQTQVETGGSTASVGATCTGGGQALEVAAGGSIAAFDVTVTADGSGFETASGGADTVVVVDVYGGGTGGDPTALVEVTARRIPPAMTATALPHQYIVMRLAAPRVATRLPATLTARRLP